MGEYYCRIGPSATVPGRVLACGYRIDAPHRSVEVISFSLPPGRDRPTYSAFEAPMASPGIRMPVEVIFFSLD